MFWIKNQGRPRSPRLLLKACYSELIAAAQQKKERRASGRGGANVIIEDASYNSIDNQQPDEKGELPQVPPAADSNGRKH